MGNLISSFFLTPIFLASLATAGIPVVIQLIHRRRAPRVWFSTLRFLLVASRRTARRRQLQNILLLILRGLLLFLLTSACFNHNLILGLAGKGPVAAVLVLDNSLSMGCLHEGTSRFERAKELAASILANLETPDSCTLILASGAGAREPAVLSHDLERIGLRIEASRVSFERSDLPSALAKAEGLLGNSTAPAKEIHLLTDMQEVSWPAPVGQGKRRSTGTAPIVLLDLSRPDFSNQAVIGVKVDSPRPVVGSTAVIKVRIHNSNDSAHTGTVRLFVGGSKQEERGFTAPAHASCEVAFDYRLKEAGLIIGRLELEADSLGGDNIRHFTMQVYPRIEVLVVGEEQGSVPFLDNTFYLLRALGALAEDASDAPIHAQQIELSELSQTQLDKYACVMLADVGTVGEPEAERLSSYVYRGGGLVVFAGERSSKGKLGALLEELFAPHDPPLSLGYEKGSTDGKDSFWGLADIGFEHPLFAPFKDEPRSLFEDVHVYRFVAVRTRADAGLTIPASLHRPGEEIKWPFVIQASLGQGKAVLFTTTCDTRWGNFPLKNLYLPLMHQLCYHLCRSGSKTLEQLAGRPVKFSFPHWRDRTFTVEVTAPQGWTQEVSSSFSNSSNQAVFEETHETGIYRYVVNGPDREEGVFIIGADPEEADLRPISEQRLRSLLGSRRIIRARRAGELEAVVSRLRQGYQLNHIMFFSVLAIALAECFLANRVRPNLRVGEAEVGRAAP